MNPESAILNGVVNDRRNGNAHSSAMSFLKSGQRVSQECDACTGLSVWIGMVPASFLSTITGRGLGRQVASGANRRAHLLFKSRSWYKDGVFLSIYMFNP